MERSLPWTRWIIEFGHPVGLRTRLGVLLTGDDGNIYVTCQNGKAYAIEVTIKPSCVNAIISANSAQEADSMLSVHPADVLGPCGVGWQTRSASYKNLDDYRKSPAGLMDLRYSASKREGGIAYLRTNAGLERFEDLLANLDHYAWDATSISLERCSPTCSLENARFEENELIYKAREIKLKERPTDRVFKGCNRKYKFRMSKPFQPIMIKDPAPAWYPTIWTASPGIVFLPSTAETDWDDVSEVERRQKARVTCNHAIENASMHRSECSWEFDAWRDIFSSIRDDPLLAMDKQEAIFLETKCLDTASTRNTDRQLGIHTVRSHRIPDCTFGLSVDDAQLLANGDKLSDVLKELFWDSQSALISDPKWLSCELAFPWAVYEAKKVKADPVVAQIRRSSELYLNMLHDLCLEPGHPESSRIYRDGEGEQFQVFSMTSEGPYWKLYVCYRKLFPEEPLWLPQPDEDLQYDIKQIWEGNITQEKMAWQLHCLVDQIHTWAVSFFRPFILERLEKWHVYLKAAQAPYYVQTLVQDNSRDFESATELHSISSTFRLNMESSFNNEKEMEALDILDQQVSQQDDETELKLTMKTPQGTPWWSKHAKPDVTRKMLLKGQSSCQKMPKRNTKKRPREFEDDYIDNRQERRTNKRLVNAYETQESKQDEEKVLSPSKSRRFYPT